MTTFTTPLNQVSSLYVGYFGRAGDPNGENYWIGQLNAKTITLQSIASSFATQPEATAKYPYLANPSLADPGTFVDQVFQNVFNHPADAAGKAYWVAQLQAAGGSASAIGAMILNVISGASGADDTTIRNKTDVASDFTVKATNAGTTWNASAAAQSSAEIAATNDTAASVTAAKAATDAYIAAAPGPQSNFTLGTDTLTASTQNANFNAPLIFNAPNGAMIQSLQSGDSATDTAPLTGPGLSNGGTFTAALNGSGLVSLVTLRGIPVHTVTNTGAAATVSGYSGDITGVTTIINKDSASPLALTLIGTPGAGIDKGGTARAGTLLSTVNIVNSASSTFVFVDTEALAGSNDTLNINVSGASAFALVSVRTDTAQIGALMNGYETMNVSTTGATTLNLTDGTAGILSTSTLNISAAGATRLDGAAIEANFTNLKTIDATTSRAGVTITGGFSFSGFLTGAVITSFKGGAGDDSLDISTMTAAQVQAITAGNLDGGSGRDTLILGTAANTTVALNNSGFEILSIGATTLAMDYSKLGTGIDTFNFTGAVTGANTVTNLGSGTTWNFVNFLNPAATGTFTAAGTGTSDTIAINFKALPFQGAITTNGFEIVTTQIENSIIGPAGWAGLTGTATAGSTLTHNLIDNHTDGGLTIGAENVGSGGTLNITGPGTAGELIFSTAPVAGTVNASGWGMQLAATTLGIRYFTPATSAQSFLGSAGADNFIGSTAADVVNSGAGNDAVANMGSLVGGAAAFDQILTGTGTDQVFFRGDVASSNIPVAYSTATNWGDMVVGTGAPAEFVFLSSNVANYAVTNASGFNLHAAPAPEGTWTVQDLSSSAGMVAITNPLSELVKLTTGVATTGLSIQTAFNTAIGSATITGASADKSYFFTMYDTTNSRMIIGIVQDHNNSTTTIETGDTVSLVGTVNMSATDYANVNANHFAVTI